VNGTEEITNFQRTPAGSGAASQVRRSESCCSPRMVFEGLVGGRGREGERKRRVSRMKNDAGPWVKEKYVFVASAGEADTEERTAGGLTDT